MNQCSYIARLGWSTADVLDLPARMLSLLPQALPQHFTHSSPKWPILCRVGR